MTTTAVVVLVAVTIIAAVVMKEVGIEEAMVSVKSFVQSADPSKVRRTYRT